MAPWDEEEAKSAWPRTTDAPAVKGGGNSRTRQSYVSATHRFPEESKAIPQGPHRELEVAVEGQLPVPTTSDALSPSWNGWANSRTLSPPVSETQRFPLGSNAIPTGSHRREREVAGAHAPAESLVMKTGCPMTIEASSPGKKGGVDYINARSE